MGRRNFKCDTVIIGAGTAGLEAYKQAKALGADCILIDQGPLGTSSQRSGELPISLLMSAARDVYAAKHLKDSGIELSSPLKFDVSGVLRSLRTIRSRATQEVLSFMYKIPEDHRLRGSASFIDEHNLSVYESNAVVSFKTAVISTGSSPLVTYEQSRLKGILTTNEFFEQESLPSSVAVFGSGKYGLQLGQALSYLDLDVTVFGQKRLWNLSSDNALLTAYQMLSSKFCLYVDSWITSMEADSDGGYTIYYLDERGYENYLHTQSAVVATDRLPNIGGMNLQQIGIKLSPAGCIEVMQDTMQTNIPHIFAAGDVCHGGQLTTIALREGKIAGRNAAAFPNVKSEKKNTKVDIVHTDPVLAIVGDSCDELKIRATHTGENFIVSEVNLVQGHYRGLRGSGGMICLYVSELSHKVLGAEICAYQGDKIAQFLALAIDCGMTAEQLRDYGYYHLSVESSIGLAAADACNRLNKIGKRATLV